MGENPRPARPAVAVCPGGEILQLRRRHQDSLDTLYHGLEIRKQLGTLANAHAMIQELHARRAEVAEVQHVCYLRHRSHAANTGPTGLC